MKCIPIRFLDRLFTILMPSLVVAALLFGPSANAAGFAPVTPEVRAKELLHRGGVTRATAVISFSFPKPHPGNTK